ncbi:hypothetical protein AHAS_Ahas03G0065800 [Arachis hypogaea]
MKVSCSLPPPQVLLARKVGAEFIGLETLIGCAVVTGLALIVIILSTGCSSKPDYHHFLCCFEALSKEELCAAFAVKEVYHPFMGVE